MTLPEGPPEPAIPARRGRSWIALLPVGIFVALGAIFLLRIVQGGDPSVIPSALIGRAAPEMVLPPLEGLEANGTPVPGFDTAAFRGEVAVVNYWASWCGPCYEEHPQLLRMAEDGRFAVVGINYRNPITSQALAFLAELGNPYEAVGVDPAARNAIEWGVYGPPETFLVDRSGVIRYRHVGPITAEILDQTIMPLIEDLLDDPAPAAEPAPAA